MPVIMLNKRKYQM